MVLYEIVGQDFLLKFSTNKYGQVLLTEIMYTLACKVLLDCWKAQVVSLSSNVFLYQL